MENIYKVGMLCKHFKGRDLMEKNIYVILETGIDGKNIDLKEIKYTGDGNLESATNLVVYKNLFQSNKKFAREYEDISSELTPEKQCEYNQIIKVQPLTSEEVVLVSSENFISLKKIATAEKFEVR